MSTAAEAVDLLRRSSETGDAQSPPLDPIEADHEEEHRLDAAVQFSLDVTREAHHLRVREAAREKVAAEKLEDAPGFDVGTLAEVLARPAEPPHRVENLIPSAASSLIVAQRKTGKTTLTLNLARCLVTGEEFLARFPVRPLEGNVAVLNYEVSGAMLGGWAHEAGIPAERLLLVNLRGRRNPLRFAEDRSRLAELLRGHDIEAMVVDPFGRAYWGKSQNDAAEVGSWLVGLDTFARAEAGVTDLILTAHTGWSAERTAAHPRSRTGPT